MSIFKSWRPIRGTIIVVVTMLVMALAAFTWFVPEVIPATEESAAVYENAKVAFLGVVSASAFLLGSAVTMATKTPKVGGIAVFNPNIVIVFAYGLFLFVPLLANSAIHISVFADSAAEAVMLGTIGLAASVVLTLLKEADESPRTVNNNSGDG